MAHSTATKIGLNGTPASLLVMIWLLATVSGCASQGHMDSGYGTLETTRSAPAEPAPIKPRGDRLANIALAMVGTPYLFGGTTPGGFDCSGLVYYAHNQLDIQVPRTTTAQRAAARPVQLSALQRGDLLFFETSWKAGHVGIYIGDGQFVHAPSSGSRVAVSSYTEGYFAPRLAAAGRFHE
ncbi:MAG: C40 family peptidase [Pseudomonadota bacterium]